MSPQMSPEMNPDTGTEPPTDEAWHRFRLALGDHLATLDGGQVVVTLPKPEALVPVRVIVTSHDGRLVTELAGLTGIEVARWRPVASLASREADRLVAVIEDAARTRFGAVDPSSLGIEPNLLAAPGPSAPPAGLSTDRPTDRPTWPSTEQPAQLSTEQPVQPTDARQLRHLIADALASLLGELPDVGDDVEIVVAVGDIPIWVVPNEDAPVVHILTVVDTHGADPTALAKVVDDLNATIGLVKFTHRGDQLTIVAELPAVPFVPSQLRSLFQHAASVMAEVITGLDERLAAYGWRPPA